MKWVRDISGRLPERPHYDPAELDQECEGFVAAFLRRKYGAVAYPLETNDLTVLLEQVVDDLDLYADLSGEGLDVEGLTEFRKGSRPSVRIEQRLSETASKRHRLRMTLAHELGHVRLHAFLWSAHDQAGPKVVAGVRCLRSRMLRARPADWLEWQAGYAGSAFLMPASALDRVAREHLTQLTRPGPLFHATVAGKTLVRRVQRAFDVSAEAARLRLLQRGHLTRQAPRPAFLARIGR
jgi:hypothetical protein